MRFLAGFLVLVGAAFATNSVRFDPLSMSNRIDKPNTFGVYKSTLTDKRASGLTSGIFDPA